MKYTTYINTRTENNIFLENLGPLKAQPVQRACSIIQLKEQIAHKRKFYNYVKSKK